MAIIEICSWVISDAFASDPSVIKPALDYLVKVDGCLGVYHGLAEEDKKTCYLFLVWETYEHHKALMDHPEYPQVIGLAPAVGTSDLKMNHVQFIQDFVPAISAPSTEVLAIKLKAGKTKEDLYGALDVLIPKIDAINTKYVPGAWGQTREEDDKFYLVVGWDSMQAHWEASGNPALAPFVKSLQDAATFGIHHVGFSKHI